MKTLGHKLTYITKDKHIKNDTTREGSQLSDWQTTMNRRLAEQQFINLVIRN